MGISTSCNDSFCEGIGCKSCLYSPNCEESCVKHEQCTFNNTEKIAKEMFLEDHEISSISEEDDDFNDSMVQELGISLCETLHIHDTLEPLCVDNPTLNQDEICYQNVVQHLSLETDMVKGLSKCALILCSEVVQSYPSTAREGLSCTTVHNEKFPETETPAFAHPLPTTRKLVSALKGSRAQQGMSLSTKLSVKWAPEVYEPPVTSSSHTMKGHHHRHHRPKAKKDNHNQKYIKGKSSRGSVAERKHAHRRSSVRSQIDPRILRLQALRNSSRPLLNSCGQTKVEAMDFGVRSQEHI